jgi:inner membrane organizing system protein 1
VGFSAGVIASVLLFRREYFILINATSQIQLSLPFFIGRTWPIALFTGFGAGAAYADCDRSFNPARIPGTRIIPRAVPLTVGATEQQSS